MSKQTKVIKIWNKPDGGRAINIPKMFRPVLEDIDFLETSFENGCLVYRPVTFSGAVVDVQSSTAPQQTNHTKRKALIC